MCIVEKSSSAYGINEQGTGNVKAAMRAYAFSSEEKK